jgi:hypothetical protein
MIKNKNFYFFTSLPRSGNTLLGSLLNQTNQINLSANSILPDIVWLLEDMKNNIIFKNFPYNKGLDNIRNNIFDLYYKDINAKNILDNGAWGTPANLNLLKKIFTKRKFVILVRPILECLASFIRVEKPKNVIERCNQLMEKTREGRIAKSIWSIENLINEKEDYIKIEYKDLVLNTKETIKKIFNFLEIEYIDFNINNLCQFNFDGVVYDDSVIYGPLHHLRTNKIESLNYRVEDYLPKEIIKKYGHIVL